MSIKLTLAEMEQRIEQLKKLYERREELIDFIGSESKLLSNQLRFSHVSEDGKYDREQYLSQYSTSHILTEGFMSLEVLKTNAKRLLKEVEEEISNLETV